MREIVGADWVIDDFVVVLIRREVVDLVRLVGVVWIVFIIVFFGKIKIIGYELIKLILNIFFFIVGI